MMFAGHMFLPTSGTPVVIAQRIGPPQTRLLSATVPAAKVRKLWPAAKQTAAAAMRCQEYLLTEMNRSPDRAPKPKRDLLADCQARFAGVSERGFERAWANAIKHDRRGWLGQGRATPETIALERRWLRFCAKCARSTRYSVPIEILGTQGVTSSACACKQL